MDQVPPVTLPKIEVLSILYRPFVEARAAHHGVSMYEEIGE